ncbi:MAG: hypothetical protein V2A75_05245 [Pseudomonadota bacterium]
MTVFTLFYGTVVGLSMFGLIYLVALNFYDVIPYTKVMEYLIFILIFGEFHYHWNRKINILEESTFYTKNRLRMLGNAFYLTKISHDQLEKGYVLQPISLRGAIASLVSDASVIDRYEHLLKRLEHYFSLESAAYFHIDNAKKIKKLGQIGSHNIEFDSAHPMIEKMIDNEQAIFVSDDSIKKTDILVVLPSFDHLGALKGALIIKEMSFMMFNLDNILKIEVILNYFEQENLKYAISNKKSNYPLLTKPAFSFEVSRMKELKIRFGIESSMLLIYADQLASISVLDYFILNNLRVLDMYEKIAFDNDEYFFLFLLPLERVSGALSFKERLIGKMALNVRKDLQTLIVGIDQIDNAFDWIDKTKRVVA